MKVTGVPLIESPMLRQALLNLSANLDSLRDFVQVLDSYLSEQKSEALETNAGRLLPLLLAFRKTNMVPADSGEDMPSEETLKRFLKDKYKMDVELEIETDKPEGGVHIRVSGEGERQFADAIRSLSIASKRKSLLYNSSLMNLTSIVELFVSECFHHYFSLHPEIIGTKDKVFSFEDLDSFGSIADAREHHLNCKIEEILYGSFSDWITFLRKTPKLSMKYLENSMASHIETFQRRNLIVHSGGKVNSIYLSRVAPELTKGVALGSSLDTDREYLEPRIDAFERDCLLIGAEFWKKLTPVDEVRGEILCDIIYRHLGGKRWPISEALCEFILKDKNASETDHCLAQLNHWLCKKRQGLWNKIEKEVELADYSAKGLKFKLGFAALREAKDDFFNLVPKALQSEEITLQELNVFPIFEEMRQDERFKPYFLEDAKVDDEELRDGEVHDVEIKEPVPVTEK